MRWRWCPCSASEVCALSFLCSSPLREDCGISHFTPWNASLCNFCHFPIFPAVVEVIERERIVPVDKVITRTVPVHTERVVQQTVTVPHTRTQCVTRQVQVSLSPSFFCFCC